MIDHQRRLDRIIDYERCKHMNLQNAHFCLDAIFAIDPDVTSELSCDSCLLCCPALRPLTIIHVKMLFGSSDRLPSSLNYHSR